MSDGTGSLASRRDCDTNHDRKTDGSVLDCTLLESQETILGVQPLPAGGTHGCYRENVGCSEESNDHGCHKSARQQSGTRYQKRAGNQDDEDTRGENLATDFPVGIPGIETRTVVIGQERQEPDGTDEKDQKCGGSCSVCHRDQGQ